MTLTSLKTTQLSGAALDWYAGFTSEVDARNADQVLAMIDDDCVIQVNDRLPIYGKAAIASGLKLYYQTFQQVEHEVLNIYGSDSSFSAELLCHYTVLGATTRVTMPAVVIYDRNASGLVVSMRLYVSAGSMFEAFSCAPS